MITVDLLSKSPKALIGNTRNKGTGKNKKNSFVFRNSVGCNWMSKTNLKVSLLY